MGTTQKARWVPLASGRSIVGDYLKFDGLEWFRFIEIQRQLGVDR